MKKHIIELSEEQRQQVEQVIRSGKAPARKISHAAYLAQIRERSQWTGLVG